MKSILVFILTLLMSGILQAADSTVLKIYEDNFIHFGGGEQNDEEFYQEGGSGRYLYCTKDLPEFSGPLQITAHLIVDTQGDPWDRAGTIMLQVPGMKNIELLKFITGFGGYSDLSRDVSFLAPLLKGRRKFCAFIDTWVNPGWVVNFELIFKEISDSTADPSWAEGIFFSAGLTRDQVTDEQPAVDVFIPKNRQKVMLTYFTSGHAINGQADEFITRDNVLYADGNEVHRYQPWRDDCRNFRDRNPMSGRWGDTWSSDFSRSGWCPGDMVYPVILDLSDALSPGVHHLRFSIEDIRKDSNGYGYWRVSSCLSGWGDISSWQPTRILLSGPPPSRIFQTAESASIRLDLADESGFTVFPAQASVRLSCPQSGALFSTNMENWSNPLTVNIRDGVVMAWFKGMQNGIYQISAEDAAQPPTLEPAGNICITVNDKEPASGESNLALNATVLTDTESDSFGSAQKATDGSLSTRWCSAGQSAHWLLLGWSDSVEINYFIVRQAGAGRAQVGQTGYGEDASMNLREFYIQKKDSAGHWLNLVGVTDNPATGSGSVTYHALNNPIKTDSIRLHVVQPDTARVYEFETYLRNLTGIEQEDRKGDTYFNPRQYRLFQNYPNPFNSQTLIKIFVPEFSQVQVSVINSRGQLVTQVLQGRLAKGFHTVKWKGNNSRGKTVASGVYFINALFKDGKGKRFNLVKKMVYVR